MFTSAFFTINNNIQELINYRLQTRGKMQTEDYLTESCYHFHYYELTLVTFSSKYFKILFQRKNFFAKSQCYKLCSKVQKKLFPFQPGPSIFSFLCVMYCDWPICDKINHVSQLFCFISGFSYCGCYLPNKNLYHCQSCSYF